MSSRFWAWSWFNEAPLPQASELNSDKICCVHFLLRKLARKTKNVTMEMDKNTMEKTIIRSVVLPRKCLIFFIIEQEFYLSFYSVAFTGFPPSCRIDGMK